MDIKQSYPQDPNGYVDRSQGLLFTTDAIPIVSNKTVEGKIVVGNYPEQIKKSETGWPYVK